MISERVKDVLEAGAAYPLEETATPQDALRLHANENRLGPPDSAVEAIREVAPSCGRYPPAVDNPLRRAIATTLDLEPEMVRLANGSDELLDLVGTAFFDPGDRVVIPTPTFGVYELAARLNGLTPLFFDLEPPRFAAPQPELVAACSEASGAFICRPNNPTGRAIDRDQLHAILETETTVVLDEAYVEFEGDSLVNWVDTYDNLIITRTFSKFYGLAGLRIGYAIASPDRIDTLGVVRSPYSVNRPAQAAALAAIHDDGFAERTRSMIDTERERLRSALDDLGFEVVPSSANFLLASTATHDLDGPALVSALAGEDVLIRDVSGFRGLDGSWVRITVGTPSENGRLITTLSHVLDSDR